jgi:hypothetical protein
MSPSLFQQTPRDTIARSFCPVVAIAASQDANDACRANNLGSFVDLIQPFGDLIEGRGNVPFSGTWCRLSHNILGPGSKRTSVLHFAMRSTAPTDSTFLL